MTEAVGKGNWVEIRGIVLGAEHRAPQVPEDTRRVPLEMRAKGFLLEPARLGEEARIRTAAGRELRGRLSEVNPAYDHSFGPPIPELGSIGGELRAILRRREPVP